MPEEPLPKDPFPTITPEIAEQLACESEAIGREFQKRIEKMWDIPPEEWRKVSR